MKNVIVKIILLTALAVFVGAVTYNKAESATVLSKTFTTKLTGGNWNRQKTIEITINSGKREAKVTDTLSKNYYIFDVISWDEISASSNITGKREIKADLIMKDWKIYGANVDQRDIFSKQATLVSIYLNGSNGKIEFKNLADNKYYNLPLN